MKKLQDLFGRLCRQYLDTRKSSELKLQLDNGILMDDFPISFYVDTREIRPLEKKFLTKARGKVLDIGCGSGRVGVYLKKSGLQVVGVDISNNLVYIAKRRGLVAFQMDINKRLPKNLFDTIVMYGNGFGMPGTIKNIENLLRRLQSITSQNALIIAESNDPNRMINQIDLEYQERNRRLGRYTGQRRWRIVSGNMVGKYQNWVQLEPELLRKIAEKTGWKTSSGPEYEKESQWGAYFFTLQKMR